MQTPNCESTPNIDPAEHIARQNRHAVNLKRAHTVLLVVHPDNTDDLWVDTEPSDGRWRRLPSRPGTLLGKESQHFVTTLFAENNIAVCVCAMRLKNMFREV
uniref:Uncharacterized protein n=1 Tax=Bradyrhizobium barranii subsp. barranii TaxID=2823807 RepID=A0A7Z0QLP5_9BRAD|nr:hypothetical protein [Bradyrhizobium barranii]